MCIEDFDIILNHDDYSYFLSLWNNTHVLLPHLLIFKAKYFVEMLWAKRANPP